MKNKIISLFTVLTMLLQFLSTPVLALTQKEKKEWLDRISLYKKMEVTTQVPWTYIAAIDQYERNVRRVRNDIPKSTTFLLGTYIPPQLMYGIPCNFPSPPHEAIVANLGGIGKDGNGDGLVDMNNPEDVLYTISLYISSFGQNNEQLLAGIWEYYHRSRTMDLIQANIKLFQKISFEDLDKHAFPVPLTSNYDMKANYGDRRSFGGLRMHEGVDIFADYGVPVRSTSYGIIVLKGWNRLGGWRIGIIDLMNNYHYYAHMGSFTKNIKVGSIVKPGETIGYVGSSGYGPPGTSGKFPPHLHYGIYKDNGRGEWTFNPYPILSQWRQQERSRRR